MHRQIGRALGRNYSTLPNPLAGVIDLIVRSYRLEVGYDRGEGPLDSEQLRLAPRTCRPLCGTLSVRQTDRLGLSVLVTPGREQGPCST